MSVNEKPGKLLEGRPGSHVGPMPSSRHGKNEHNPHSPLMQGLGGGDPAPSRRPPLRACLCAISARDWKIVIPEGGRVTQIKCKRNNPSELPVTPELVPESKNAITRRDALKETLTETRPGGGKRGAIQGFSARSRLRLMILTASVNYALAGLPVFMTLTYGEWDPDPCVWKEDLRRFLMAVRRTWPMAWGLWKLEFQKRGAPHFHLLLWDGPKVQGFRAYYQSGKYRMMPHGREKVPANGPVFDFMDKNWGDRHGLTRIEPVQTVQGVMAYAGKYLGKLEVAEGHTGRIWGQINRAAWAVNITESRVDYREAMRFRRVARKWSQRVNGYKSRNPGQIQGMTIFMRAETAERLKTWACEARNGCPF